MQFIFNLFTSYPYIELPYDAAGWIGLFFVLGLLVFMLMKARDTGKTFIKKNWLLFLLVVGFSCVTALFIGFRFPSQQTVKLFGLPFIYQPAAVMIFAAVPITLCAGFFGTVGATLAGALTGLMIGLWDTHHIFTVFEYAGLGLLFSWLIRQCYKSAFFSLIRHPLLASFIVPAIFIPITMFNSLFVTGGELAIRIDYALTQSWHYSVSHFVVFFVGGAIAEAIYLLKVKTWVRCPVFTDSPIDRNLSLKFTVSILPIFIAAFVVLLLGDWVAAGQASRKLIEDRLANMSAIAAESLPFFLETGQNLVTNFADEELLQMDADSLRFVFEERLNSIPYFTEFILFDADGELVYSYPQDIGMVSEADELAAVNLALEGAQTQTCSVRPGVEGANGAKTSFIASINNSKNQVVGVLLGRTDIATNPFTQPAIRAIDAIVANGGEGWVMDEESHIVYHSDPGKLMDRFYGYTNQESRFYEQSNPGEPPKYIYFKRSSGRPWAFVLSVPTTQVQQLAMDIAVPLLIILALLSLSIIILLQYLISLVTSDLKLLAGKATQIAHGKFSNSLQIHRDDEVGQFASAFEQMRLSLLARLDEIKSLLKVSHGVASNLDIHQAFQPILDTCIAKGASTARVILYEQDMFDIENKGTLRLAAGERPEQYAHLDEVIFEMVKDEDVLVVPNCHRYRVLSSHKRLPGALMAFCLMNDQKVDGVIWLGFDRAQQFEETDLQFFSTLAGQAAIAVVNANLYASAEVGRQRIETILASLPEPVLVFDHKMRLQFLNAASTRIPRLLKAEESGAYVADVVAHKTLLELLLHPDSSGTVTQELAMPNGKTFMASVANVMSGEQPVGKICMLRDVSYYKELNEVKSEFVSTVSHDLKSPLTLLSGYTRLLEMVGDLNPQQKGYTQKIAQGIEQMTHLVNSILDIERIESGMALNVSKVNAIDLIEKIVVSLEPPAKQKSIQIIIQENADSNVAIETDADLLQQALHNLIENAIKYTNFGGQIEIAVEYGEDSIEFKIKDNGMGISPVDLQYVFEKFYRSGDKDMYRQRGTGLGLAIVKSISEKLGGRVWVKSDLGKGSTFFFELPYYVQDGEGNLLNQAD